MDCEVAREALSARLDGEREPVPSARVDQHLDECSACRDWFDRVGRQAAELRRLVEARPVIAPVGPIGLQTTAPRRRFALSRQRWALLCVGVAQIVLAVVQGTGLDVGLHGGMAATSHLLHESTSWSFALGVIMVIAALWPAAAAGLAGVLTVFVALIAVYVTVDAVSGTVTVGRILTHLPVLLGAFLATIVWRTTPAPGPAPQAEPDIVLPHNASRGRRRGHLWPTDGSAA
jgi:predicted anti-sigma-YlaC factor YlaD